MVENLESLGILRNFGSLWESKFRFGHPGPNVTVRPPRPGGPPGGQLHRSQICCHRVGCFATETADRVVVERRRGEEERGRFGREASWWGMASGLRGPHLWPSWAAGLPSGSSPRCSPVSFALPISFGMSLFPKGIYPYSTSKT